MNTTDYLMPGPDEETDSRPHNLEMEQALLGAILVNNECLAMVEFLLPEHFFEPLHGRIYAACVTLNGAGSVASPVTLKDFFSADEGLKAVGGAQYLARLTVAAVTVLHSKDYGAALYDLWVKRCLIEIGEKAITLAGAPKAEESAEDILHQVEDELGGIRGAPLTAKTAWTLGAAVVDVLQHTEGLQNGERSRDIVGSGLQCLDERLAWFRGDLNIIGARTGMGKSMFSCQVAMNLAEAGYNVGFFSPDMEHKQMAARMMTSWIAAKYQQAVVYEKVLKGTCDQLDMRHLAQAAQAVYNYPILMDDRGKPTVATIMSRCRDWQRQYRALGGTLDVLIVDHLHKLSGTSSARQRGPAAEVREISGDLAAAARDLGVTLLAFAQLTDHDKTAKDIKAPNLWDLRYAAELEHDARSVLFLHRPWYFREKQEPKRRDFKNDMAFEDEHREWECDKADMLNLMELHIAKQNNGAKGVVKVYCHLPTSYIGESKIFP